MPWVVEMTGFDPAAGVEKTLRFAMGQGIAFTDQPYAAGALKKWSSSSQNISFSASGRVEMTTDGGELVLANSPDDVSLAGPLDSLINWIWQNRTVTLCHVPARSWADRIVVARGILEQPVSRMGDRSTLLFSIRDPRAALETPLQPVKFEGTNVGPAGLEGGESLKGRPKPILYGLVSNFSPPRVNDSLLIYQLADKGVSVLCVRDGGVSLGLGVVRANLNSLQTTAPAPGRYDVYSGATGTFIRLGSNPIYGIACDADEAPNEAEQSHAYIWSRMRAQRISPGADLASIAGPHAADPHGAGFYWDSEITQRDALNEVLGSFSGFELQTITGTWQLQKLVLPTGTPEIDLVQLTAATRLKPTSRILKSINLARPKYMPDGAPPYRVIVQWGRNYTVMQPNDFAGAAIDRLREKFAVEYRQAIASDLATWNPVSQIGPWKNAPELTIEAAYQPGAGGLTSPGAEAEATRLLALFGSAREQYVVQFMPEIGDSILPGDVVRLTHPRNGLSAGALFRVLEAGLTVEGGESQADLVVGLKA